MPTDSLETSSRPASTLWHPDVPAVSGRRIRTLVAGAGYIADYHLAILRENAAVDVVGICDPQADRLEALAAKWQVPTTAPDLGRLARAVNADAVHVLTPPQTHTAVVTEALESGLHVLAEKPLALSLAQTDALMALATERGLRLDANHNAAWHPQFLNLKADIAARRLGAVQHVVALQNVPLAQLAAGAHGHWMFNEPRNVLFEQGPHPLSQICDLLGAVRSAATTCSGPRVLRTGATFYDTWQVSLVCEHGTAQLYMAFDGAFPYWQLHVIGQDATSRIDLLANTSVLDRATPSVPPVDALRRGLSRGMGEAMGAARQMARYVGATLKVTGRRDPYYVSMKGCIDAFHRRLAEGAPTPLTPLDRHVAEGLDIIADGVPALVTPERAAAPAIATSTAPADVLVIGATGFIGPYLVDALAAHGRTVRVMARTPRSLPDSVRYRASGIAEGDVRDKAAVAAAVRGCRRVVHLVASAPEGWSEYERLYLDGTRYVAEACLDGGVEQLQFASSIAALYLGKSGDIVTNLTPPDGRPDDRCDYAKAKILCERLLLALHRERKLPVVIVRPGIVVGAGGPPQHLGVGHWASPTRCIAWGTGDHPLPFVLASDVAAAMAAIDTRDDLHGRAFNLAGDVRLRASEYVAALAALSKRDVQLRPRSLMGWWALEHVGWAVKAVGRKANNAALSWRELTYRTGAATLDCVDTKRDLGWRPESDRDRFIDMGIRAAIRP
jgi:predicted dehydrogenase/nucleoside-diphosphate-sugar epimerase